MERILRFLTKNKLLVNVIILSIFIFGIVNVFQIKQDLAPPASPDVIAVTILYPGAATKDVELNAIIPIERKLKGILGIKDYFSIAVENSGRVVIYLDQDFDDIQTVKNEIFRELNNIPDLAEEVEDVILKDLNPKLRSIYKIGVYPKKDSNINRRELQKYVDMLEDKLSVINGVSYIDKEGYLDNEIKIHVIPDKLKNYYISLNEIIDSVHSRNVRLTGGTLQSLKKDKNIVTIGEFENPLEVKEVIIRSDFEGNRIRIQDIAKVENGYKDKNVEVIINGNNGITLDIRKKGNADIVKTVKRIKNLLKIEKYNVPEDIEITTITDESLTIISLLDIVKSNALIGFFFVFIILLIFLSDLRISFWTAFGIPFVILTTIIILNQFDFSLNLISLVALITVMGMLVDDGIVISENIYKYKMEGIPPVEAAIKGLKEVITPVTVSSATTIIAFLPMLSLGGMMGKFIYVFPIVVTITLFVSLFEASSFLPVHLAHAKLKIKSNINWFEPVANGYKNILKIILKFRYIVIIILIILFIIGIKLAINPVKKFILIDDDSSSQIFIKLEAATGTNIRTTAEYTKDIEKIISEELLQEELISVKTTVGHHITNGMKNKGYRENWALVSINLVPLAKRNRKANVIINSLRKKINTVNLKNFEKIFFEKTVFGPPTGDPVDIKIISEDEIKALELMKQIETYLKNINGVIDIDNDQKRGKDEIKIDFDYEKMASLGVDVSSVAIAVRTAYEGVIATSTETTNQKLDFRVQVDENFHTDQTFLLNLLIPNKKGNLVKLKDIASLSFQKAISIINHYNGDRVITITANIDSDITTSRKVSSEIKSMFGTGLPGVKVLLGGESKETKETIGGLAIAFLLAIVLIYFTLLVLFKSLTQPLLILMTVPFAIIGAIMGLVINNMSLSFMAAVGIVGLCGVVVNDNIVLVDFINKIFKQNPKNKSYINLITEGAKNRFRPVALTTITTIVALIPTILGIGGYSGRIIPVVIVMAYGLLIDTIVTLILLPCLYLIRIDIIGIPKMVMSFLTRKK